MRSHGLFPFFKYTYTHYILTHFVNKEQQHTSKQTYTHIHHINVTIHQTHIHIYAPPKHTHPYTHTPSFTHTNNMKSQYSFICTCNLLISIHTYIHIRIPPKDIETTQLEQHTSKYTQNPPPIIKTQLHNTHCQHNTYSHISVCRHHAHLHNTHAPFNTVLVSQALGEKLGEKSKACPEHSHLWLVRLCNHTGYLPAQTNVAQAWSEQTSCCRYLVFTDKPTKSILCCHLGLYM